MFQLELFEIPPETNALVTLPVETFAESVSEKPLLEDELELLDDDNEEDEDEFMVKSIFRSKRDNEIVSVANSVANKRQLREMLGDDFFN